MEHATIEYKRKVWQFLEKVKPGKTYTIAKIVKPENQEFFINAVKEYMDSLPWQGYITFNHDYSKFYRMHPPIMKGEN